MSNLDSNLVSEFFVKGFLVKIVKEEGFLTYYYKQIVFAPCGEKTIESFVDTRTFFRCPKHPEEGYLIFSDRTEKFYWRKPQKKTPCNSYDKGIVKADSRL